METATLAPPPAPAPPSRFGGIGFAVAATAGLSTAFDGRRDLASAFELSLATRAGDGTLALVAGDALSSGGSAWSAGCRGAVVRRLAGLPVDLAADLRIARLRAGLDGDGRTVASELAATLAVAGARAGVTFRAWPGAWVSVAAVAESSLSRAERSYAAQECPVRGCPDPYRLGGFAAGLAVAVGSSPRR